MKRLTIIVITILLCFSLNPISLSADTAVNETIASKVYYISVEKAVEAGLSSYMERAFRLANEDPTAQAVILEIDTPGGAVDAAQAIRKTIEGSSLQTIALVKGGAISAGTYIAMSCDLIAMQPGSTIGDVEPRIGNERADEKYVSYLAGDLAGLAEAHGRDKDIARAMVDRDMVIEGYKEAGKLLTLTAQEAKEVGYADYLVNNRQDLKSILGLSAAIDEEVEPSKGENVARFLTSPYVAPILLMLGLAGIAIELFTVGFGVAGIIGFLSFALYFWGHLFAGFSGWATILLFLAGIILLLIEVVVPGFGIFGVSGIVCMGVGILITAPSLQIGLQSLVIAIIGTCILMAFAFKHLTKRKFWQRLILNTKFDKGQGYISQNIDYVNYVGKKARTMTDLRPAGIIALEDGTRLDVVSDGGYIKKDLMVIVTQVDGPRIVVTLDSTQ